MLVHGWFDSSPIPPLIHPPHSPLFPSFFLVLLVASDASALVALITRFTEEAFATLISIVFIIQAFEKLFEISYEAPITRHPQVGHIIINFL